MLKRIKGFTLIELLVVIGILAILLAITLIAINPARQFGQANNTKRRSDILQILNGIHQYSAEHSGSLPAGVSGLAACASPCATATAFNNTTLASLCTDLVTTYLPALPRDPTQSNGANINDCTVIPWDTGYQISRDAQNRVTIYAPSAENGATINVTR